MKKKQASVPTLKDGTPDVGVVGLARLLTRQANAKECRDHFSHCEVTRKIDAALAAAEAKETNHALE